MPYNLASPIRTLDKIVPLKLLRIFVPTRFIGIGVLLVLTCPVALSQYPFRGWQWQNPLPQGNSINSIKFANDKRRGWAVGGDGVVLTTNNGGFEWDEQISSANTTLYSIYIK